MGLFSTKIEEEIVAVLDISSGGVSGSMVLKNPKALPFVLASTSKTFAIRESIDADRLKREMLEALDHVCVNLQKSAMVRPAKVYCVLSTPWSHGELRSISVKREAEFQFTEIFAQKLITEEISKFEKENSGNNQIIDRKITKVALNGYTVKSPHGQKTRDAHLDVFLSISLSALIENLQDKIHKTFKSKILFTSQMLADFIFTRGVLASAKDLIILNAGGEITEVAILKSGALSGTAFFPYGTNSIIRTMAQKLGKSIAETQSLLRLHADGSLNDDGGDEVTEAVRFSIEMWQSGLKQILIEILPNRHIPHQIFLAAPAEISAWLGSRLSAKFFPEFTTANADFDVTIADIKTLHDFYDKAPGTRPGPNTLIKSIYINQI